MAWRRARNVGGAEPRWAWVALACLGAACGYDGAGDGAAAGTPTETPATPDRIVDVAWAPDGSRIVVAWDRGQGARLFGLLPGTVEEPPTPSHGLPLTYGQESSPTWSPDRLWIAYEGRAGGNVDIYRMRPDGSGNERLTDDPAPDTDPAWSPDGRRIAFVSERGGNGPRLHLMDADGGNVRAVPFDMGDAHAAPVWDPRGRRLAVQVREGAQQFLYLVDPETGASGRMGPGTQPAWSPDGSRVYFSERDSVFWRPADGGLRRFVVADGRIPAPAPDGRRLAFVRGNPPVGALYLLDLEEMTEVPVTPPAPR